MKHYLSIILRNHFNLFYRFGYTFIPNCHLIEFSGEITEETKSNIGKLFCELPPFEWEEEYLIIEFEKSSLTKSAIQKIEIQDIVKVIPLSNQAKASIETKIDIRIKLENPIFESLLPLIEEQIEKNELEKAIQALWKVCEINGKPDDFLNSIGLENIFNGVNRRKSATKSANIQNGNYWEYVIAYDRFDYYPNSIIGYFYDAGQIFANSKGHSSFEGSGLHKLLESIHSANPNAKIREIISLLEKEEQSKGYIKQTSSSGMLYYLITPLYLMLRDELRESEDIYQTNLFKHLKSLKEYNDSFKYAIILLGAFFGFKKFYDIYYDHLNLRFYKTNKIVEKYADENNISQIVEQPGSSQKNEEDPLAIKLPEEEVKPVEILQENVDIVTDVKQKTESVADSLISEKHDKGPKSKPAQDDLGEYKAIILEEVGKIKEAKLKDIGNSIKQKTGRSMNNIALKNIVETMDSVEVFRKKNTEMVRLKTMQDLF